jgi:hypothetical protein
LDAQDLDAQDFEKSDEENHTQNSTEGNEKDGRASGCEEVENIAPPLTQICRVPEDRSAHLGENRVICLGDELRSVVIAALSDFELLIAALAGDAINEPIFNRDPA